MPAEAVREMLRPGAVRAVRAHRSHTRARLAGKAGRESLAG